MRHALMLLTTVLCVATARPAAAQFLATDDRPEFITLSTTTTSAVVVGVIMLTVVSVRKDPTALKRYMEQNEPAVRAAFALGGGAVLDDIGTFFGIDERHSARFAALLRRHREVLLDAVFVRRDGERFAELVASAMRLDPRLRAFAQR